VVAFQRVEVVVIVALVDYYYSTDSVSLKRQLGDRGFVDPALPDKRVVFTHQAFTPVIGHAFATLVLTVVITEEYLVVVARLGYLHRPGIASNGNSSSASIQNQYFVWHILKVGVPGFVEAVVPRAVDYVNFILLRHQVYDLSAVFFVGDGKIHLVKILICFSTYFKMTASNSSLIIICRLTVGFSFIIVPLFSFCFHRSFG
jgi:hypothetical protein